MPDEVSESGPEPFFDRQAELGQLDAIWSAPGAQLVTVWGRRRVGKSALLSRFAAGKSAVYLYGTRIAEADVLRSLAFQVATTFGDAYLQQAPFPSWDAALTYFEARARSGRLLIVLDEFPYLCEVTPGLDTLIQRWWDQVHRRADLVLVLAGSGFSFMEGLVGARGALHGRRSYQIDVHPFDYRDAAAFFPELAPEDQVRAFACYGGIPAYLEHWRANEGLAGNLIGRFLAPGHFLFREAEELLRTEFHQEALYASILRAIAQGEHRPSDIARAVGRHSADEIFDHLRRLQELRFIRRESPITEWQRSRSSRSLYLLSDPYLRFWFTYVSPFQSYLQLGRAEDLWRTQVAPTLDEFVARTTWEDVCLQHLWRRLAANELSVQFSQLGRWWDGQDEIDLVGLWGDRVTLIGECKWTSTEVDERVLLGLQQKSRKLASALDVSPLWVLASRSGFTPSIRQRAERGEVLLIQPSDLYR